MGSYEALIHRAREGARTRPPFKRSGVGRRVLVALGVCALAFVWARQPLLAREMTGSNISVLSNVGFLKSPPARLKETFPICDAFLNVRWIDKQRRIGYAHYEASDGWESDSPEKRYSVWALVILSDLRPVFNLDISQFRREHKMHELIDLVKRGKLGKGVAPYTIGGKAFYGTFIKPVLSDYRQTVCVTYPDESKAWIIEGRRVANAYSDDEKRRLVGMLNAAQLPFYSDEYVEAHGAKNVPGTLTRDQLDSFELLDINRDGKDDLLRIQAGTEFVAYSVGGRYYRMALKDMTDRYSAWYFPPSQRVCVLKPYHVENYITTDGKSYFLNNQCNLTSLTSNMRRE